MVSAALKSAVAPTAAKPLPHPQPGKSGHSVHKHHAVHSTSSHEGSKVHTHSSESSTASSDTIASPTLASSALFSSTSDPSPTSTLSSVSTSASPLPPISSILPSTPVPVIPIAPSNISGADAAAASVAAAKAQARYLAQQRERRKSGAIIGGVLGGVVLFCVVFFCLRRQAKTGAGKRIDSSDSGGAREVRVAGLPISHPTALKATHYGEYDESNFAPVLSDIDLSPPPVVGGYEVAGADALPPSRPSSPTEGGWLRKLKEGPSWGRLYYTRLFYRVDPGVSTGPALTQSAIPTLGRRASRNKGPQ